MGECQGPFTRAIFCAIFVALELAIKIASVKLAVISVRFVAVISQRFPTCSKLDATWRLFGGNCSRYRTGITAKSLLVLPVATKVALESATKIAPKIISVNGPSDSILPPQYSVHFPLLSLLEDIQEKQNGKWAPACALLATLRNPCFYMCLTWHISSGH